MAMYFKLSHFKHSHGCGQVGDCLRRGVLVAILLLAVSVIETCSLPACGSEIWCHGPLLQAVQNAKLFADSKTFVDMNLKYDPGVVLGAFAQLTATELQSRAAIGKFVDAHFEGPDKEFEPWQPTDYVDSPAFLQNIKDPDLRQFGRDMCRIWSTLGRKIKNDVKLQQDRYSLIYSENPFIVPGGRFRETYYWDSYWVIKGLLICEMKDTARGMLENFVSLIKRYGMIPNGNRVYYTRRSQPPLFIAMVKEYVHFTGDQDFLEQNIAYMETEYMFWMANRSVEVGYNGHQHLVNRYAAPITEPRPESYREDIDTVKTANLGQRHVEPSLLYSSLASAAESGWDFSSRWFSAGYAQEDSMVDWLRYTDTSNVVPVDLNAILCWNERLLADMFRTLGQTAKATIYKNKHELRKEQMHDLFWDNNTGAWFDFSVTTNTHRKNFYPSNIFPVFAGCFEHSQEVEEKVLHYLKDAGVLNYVSGIPTSTMETGQQWDFPNAWPPLQHVVIQALAGSSNLQMRHEALQLTQGWINSNFAGWKRTGHMFEKYVVTKSGSRGSGGEYDVQDGFGWTNGVVLDLLYSFGQDLYYNDPDTVNHCNIVSAPAVQWLIMPICVAQTFLQKILTNPSE